MPTASRAKHKFCRRIGQCIWGDPKCPSVKRPYAAGPHGKGRRVKLSTYGELLMEKQKLKNYYAISEKQLQIAYAKAKAGTGQTHEKLFRSLEQRLDAMVFRAGFAPTIFASTASGSTAAAVWSRKARSSRSMRPSRRRSLKSPRRAIPRFRLIWKSISRT